MKVGGESFWSLVDDSWMCVVGDSDEEWSGERWQ